MNRIDSPRVILADDHVEILKHASSILAESCQVVASVGDGLTAVEQTMRLDPDVVVLDITMPGLDGFQAARELKRRGSRAKVVFLSLHEGDEFVVTGFRAGGRAYVPKPRMPADLPSAVEHVHAGRVFVPTLTSLSSIAAQGGHAAMFYSRHDAWCDEAARLVGVALSRGDEVAVFASDVTRMGVAKRLAARGLDTARVMADGRYTVADADETLEQISRNGHPDAQRIAAVVDDLETRLASSKPASRLTILGEIAPRLPRERVDDILGIERLWNTLAGERRFLTVCAYSMDGQQRDGSQDGLWPGLCTEHWAVAQALD